MTIDPPGPAPLRGDRARWRVRRRLPGRATGAALAVALGFIAGCAAEPEPSGGPPSGQPAASLAATITQYREDEIAGRLQVSLTNRGSEAVVVESVRVDSADFAPADPSRPALHLAPGQRTDVPVAYGAVRCAGTVPRSAGAAVVHVDVAGPAQPARPLVLAVPPPVAALDRLVERSCRREQLQRVLDVSVVDVRIPRDGDRVDARLRVDVTPGTGALTLTSVDGSVMFALELLDTATLQPGGSATVPLRIRPGRCDPHAFLESKRSFLFTAYVRPAAGEASYLVFELDDVTTQARLTAWARERCGL